MSSPSDLNWDVFFKDFVHQKNRLQYELAEAETTGHENESMGLSCHEENTTTTTTSNNKNNNASGDESISAGPNSMLNPEHSQVNLIYHPHLVSYNFDSVSCKGTTTFEYPPNAAYAFDNSFQNMFQQNDAAYQSLYRATSEIDYHPPGMMIPIEEDNTVAGSSQDSFSSVNGLPIPTTAGALGWTYSTTPITGILFFSGQTEHELDPLLTSMHDEVAQPVPWEDFNPLEPADRVLDSLDMEVDSDGKNFEVNTNTLGSQQTILNHAETVSHIPDVPDEQVDSSVPTFYFDHAVYPGEVELQNSYLCYC
jgi:hypothetical protein